MFGVAPLTRVCPVLLTGALLEWKLALQTTPSKAEGCDPRSSRACSPAFRAWESQLRN